MVVTDRAVLLSQLSSSCRLDFFFSADENAHIPLTCVRANPISSSFHYFFFLFQIFELQL